MIIKKMKKLLLLICLLPMASMAQTNTYVITQTGQAEFDTARVFKLDSLTKYVTPSQLSDSLATVGTDTNALKTNTPLSTTLDTVQRNGINSALSVSTNAISVNGNIGTTNNGSISVGGTGNIYTTNGNIFTSGVGNIFTNGTGDFYTTDGNISVGGASKRFNGSYLTASTLLISDAGKNIISAPVSNYPSLTELTYLKGVTSAIQTQINAKAPLANPTFTGTVTIPTPFTLGATSVTSTGTQLNYLSSATGTTGTTSTNLVFSTSPTLVTPNLGTPSTLVGTNITGTASGLTAGNVTTNANLTGPITSVGNATSIASQTGTGTKFVVDNTPTLITPILGVASATSLNTGTTLNGTIFAKSANVLSLSSTNHALTAGNESTGLNLALGLYSTSLAIQARNNGSASNIFYNPLGGTVQVGDGSVTGQRLFSVINTGSGTGDWSSIEVRNAAASTDAIRMYCLGTGFTTSGTNVQDAGVLTTGTNISGGMSIGTQASADLRFYTNNTLRTTIDANGYTNMTNRLATAYATVASANNLTLTTGNVFSITGTTQITAITNTNWQAGSQIILIFAGVLTVKNNTAGGAGTSPLLLAGGVDFATTANDVLKLVYNGTNWIEVSRSIN